MGLIVIFVLMRRACKIQGDAEGGALKECEPCKYTFRVWRVQYFYFYSLQINYFCSLTFVNLTILLGYIGSYSIVPSGLTLSDYYQWHPCSGVIGLGNFFLDLSAALAYNCLPKDYGHGSTVCVCNTQHCDAIPRVQKVEPTSYIVYTSDKAGQRFNTTTNKFQRAKRDNKSGYFSKQGCKQQTLKDYPMPRRNQYRSIKELWNMTEKAENEIKEILINQDVTYQSILGFGGAFTDAAGINIKSLNKDLQNKLLRSYFSDEGIEYNLGRVPIGGTDFSTRGYTYMDSDEDDDYIEDPLLTTFQLVKEDYLFKIPFIQEALKLRKDLLLLGSGWTAPKWMKENRDYNGICAYLRKEMYEPWANYFIKFLDSYQNHNITFWGITTGNEIYFAMGLFKIPAVLWTPEEIKDWIRFYFGPAVRNSSYSNIKILTNDDNRPTLTHSLDTVFSEKENLEYIDGAAVHWYFHHDFNTYILDETHHKFPDKFLLYTEACNGIAPLEPVLLGSWERAEKYAKNILQDFNHWVVGWMDWNIALDLDGGPTYIKNFVDSSIIVNATAQEFYKQPMYYAIEHFSKFIPRDSVRIYSSQCDSEVEVVAFKKPDGGVVIVILNTSDSIQRRTIVDAVKGQISLELSSHSISTVLYW